MKIRDNISKNCLSAIFFLNIAMLMLLPSCFNDNFNQAMKLELFPYQVLMPEDDYPMPGNGGIITTGAINDTSIQLIWSPASDMETPQSELEYRVYRSDSDNINNPDDADKHGTVVAGWQKNITTAVAGALSSGITYYFNIIVRDGAGNRTAYLTLSAGTASMPVPGNGGIITTNAIGSTSIQLTWTRATDAETSQPDLEYSMYRSDSNNINTPDDAVNNGTVVADWQKDMVTALADSLSSGTTYYFNVVVRDGDSNRSAYVTIAVTTASDAIYMFSAGSYTGDLAYPTSASIRKDIDALCGTSGKKAMPPCLNRRAFISISSSDDIASMPKNFGVPTDRKIIGLTGIQIADNWSDLLDGSIDETLSDAGIASDHWWSGSLSSGIYDTSVDNCTGWTSTSKIGQSGKFNKTDATWIEGETPACNDSRIVLCVCW